MKNTTLTLLGYRQALEFRRQGHWGDDSIYEYVRKQTERAPDAFAIRDASRRWTYRELLTKADQLANALSALGVRAGERVAIGLPSCVEIAAIMLACSRNGYVCCPSLHRDHTVGDVAAQFSAAAYAE